MTKSIVCTLVLLVSVLEVFCSNEVPIGPLHLLERCSSEKGPNAIINCAAEKMLKSLDKISEQPSIQILPGVSITSDTTQTKRTAKELQVELPENASDKLSKIMDIAFDSFSKMISGRTLKIKMPDSESLGRALGEGRPGRRRNKNKMSNSWLMGGILFTLIIPAVLSGLGLLTAKAIIVAKVALVVSVISFIQYFIRNGSSLLGYYNTGYGNYGFGTQSTYGVPYPTGTNNLGPPIGGPYRRSFQQENDVADAQQLAYSAHQDQQQHQLLQ